MKISQVHIIHATILLLLTIVNVNRTMARPRPAALANSLDKLSGCHIDTKLQDTCQRCAKATKSNVVYPMCCSNEDDAYIWCKKYMGYGIHRG